MPRLLSDMDYTAAQPGLRQVIVPLTTLDPTVTTDQLAALGLNGLGSQFTTYYDQRNKPRAQNIAAGGQARRRHGHQGRRGLLAERHARAAHAEPRLRLRAGHRSDGVLRQGVGGGCASSRRRSSTRSSSPDCRSSSVIRTTSSSITTRSAATPQVACGCAGLQVPQRHRPRAAAPLLGRRRRR